MIDLLHEDPDLWVLNKPANISLLADRQSPQNLWQALQLMADKPYLVHRLDKGTSGVLLVARNQKTQTELTRQFAQHQVNKTYAAWVTGHFPKGNTYHIHLPLCKGRKSRYRVAGERHRIELAQHTFRVEQDRDGVTAFTSARVVMHTVHHSLLLLKPVTGRTHQLRVHLSWLGYPLVGDHLYGNKNDPQQAGERLMLHCLKIKVPKRRVFKAPIPAAFNSQTLLQ